MNPFFTDGNVAVAMLCVVLGLAFTLAVSNRDQVIGPYLVLAFAVRSLVSLGGLPFNAILGYEKDALNFENHMALWSTGSRPSMALVFPGANFYPWMMSFVYQLTGRVPSLILWLNVMFGALSCYLAAKTAQRIWGDRSARWTAVVLALFPYYVFQSTVLLREAPICFGLTLGAYAIVRTIEKWHAGWWLLSFFSLLFATGLHDAIGVFLLIWIFYTPYAVNRSGRPRLAKILTLASVLTCLGFLVILLGSSSGKLAQALSQSQSASGKVMALNPDANVDSRANYEYLFPVGNVPAQAALSPAETAVFFSSPTIWMVRTPLDVIGFFDGLAYLYILYLVWKTRTMSIANVRAKALLFCVLGAALLLGAVTMNYGTALRHRAKLLPILVVLASAIVIVPPKSVQAAIEAGEVSAS